MAVRRSTTESAIAAGAEKRATPLPARHPDGAQPEPRVRLMIAHRFLARLWRPCVPEMETPSQISGLAPHPNPLPDIRRGEGACRACATRNSTGSAPQSVVREVQINLVRVSLSFPSPHRHLMGRGQGEWQDCQPSARFRKIKARRSSHRFRLRHSAISASVITGLIVHSVGAARRVGGCLAIAAAGSGPDGLACVVAASPSFSRTERRVANTAHSAVGRDQLAGIQYEAVSPVNRTAASPVSAATRATNISGNPTT